MTAAQVNFFLNKEVNLVITTKPAFNVIIFACFEAIISINWIAIAYSMHIHFSHNKVRGFNRMRESEVSFFQFHCLKKGLCFCLFVFHWKGKYSFEFVFVWIDYKGRNI